jgi:subtilisin family serine protease
MSFINLRTKATLVILMFALFFTALPELIAGVSFAQVGAEQVGFRGPFVPGRVLVGFRSEVRATEARARVEALGSRASEEISGIGVHVVQLPPGVDEEFFVKAFKAQPEVEFAELDRLYAPDEMIPNDPNYPTEWHLPRISSPTAWSTTTGSSNVIIAILDTGVDPNHEDLGSKLVPGWNFYDNNSNTTDLSGHGTAVAGTAAASSNNLAGVASVAWGCRIMPIRISDPNGMGSTSAMANGLTWAADHGARVANISYAATGSSTVSSAARYFRNRGGVVTVSAGNSGTFSTSTDNPDIITVSATTSSDNLASWSNRGNNIDLAAPGTGILTTNRGGGYGSWSGTSFSAPLVAGAAALLISANSGLNASQIEDALEQSADDLGTVGWDTNFGAGRINVAAAVQRVGSGGGDGGSTDTTAPSVTVLSPTDGATLSGASVNVTVSTSDDTGVVKVELYVDGTLKGSSTVSPFTIKLSTKKLFSGAHTMQSRAYDAAGNVGLSSVITVYK